MGEEFIEHGIKCSIKQIIRAKVENEIEEQVEKFREKLEDRKDNYIAEIMKGIRINHEMNDVEHLLNYRITFENVWRKGE